MQTGTKRTVNKVELAAKALLYLNSQGSVMFYPFLSVSAMEDEGEGEAWWTVSRWLVGRAFIYQECVEILNQWSNVTVLEL